MGNFCSNCGKPLGENEKFCSECGAKNGETLVNVQPGSPAMIVSPTAEYADDISETFILAYQKKEKKKVIISILIGALVFFMLTGAVSNSDISVAPMTIVWYLVTAFMYTFWSKHHLKKIFRLPFIIWPWVFFFYYFIDAFSGMLFYFPRAIIRWISRKPLINKENVEDLYYDSLI